MPEKENKKTETKKEIPEEAQEDQKPDSSSGNQKERQSLPAKTSGMMVFLTPEIIMFIPAILLDLVNLVLIFFALDDFFIGDIVGIVIIGGWIFFRSQTVKVTKRASQKIGKAAEAAKKMKWLRPLMFLVELVPYVGVLPCWTLLVYFELQT